MEGYVPPNTFKIEKCYFPPPRDATGSARIQLRYCDCSTPFSALNSITKLQRVASVQTTVA